MAAIEHGEEPPTWTVEAVRKQGRRTQYYFGGQWHGAAHVYFVPDAEHISRETAKFRSRWLELKRKGLIREEGH